MTPNFTEMQLMRGLRLHEYHAISKGKIMEYALYNGNKISATAVAEDYNFEKSVRIHTQTAERGAACRLS